MKKVSFRVRNFDTEQFLTYNIDNEAVLDEDVLTFLEDEEPKGIVPVIFEEEEEFDTFSYDITDKIRLCELSRHEINAEMVLMVLRGIAVALVDMSEKNIPLSYLVLHRDYIYINSEYEVEFICIPLQEMQEEADLNGFLRSFVAHLRYDTSEDGDYVSKLLSFINNPEIFNLQNTVELVDFLMDERGISLEKLSMGNSGDVEKTGQDAMAAQKDVAEEKATDADYNQVETQSAKEVDEEVVKLREELEQMLAEPEVEEAEPEESPIKHIIEKENMMEKVDEEDTAETQTTDVVAEEPAEDSNASPEGLDRKLHFVEDEMVSEKTEDIGKSRVMTDMIMKPEESEIHKGTVRLKTKESEELKQPQDTDERQALEEMESQVEDVRMDTIGFKVEAPEPSEIQEDVVELKPKTVQEEAERETPAEGTIRFEIPQVQEDTVPEVKDKEADLTADEEELESGEVIIDSTIVEETIVEDVPAQEKVDLSSVDMQAETGEESKESAKATEDMVELKVKEPKPDKVEVKKNVFGLKTSESKKENKAKKSEGKEDFFKLKMSGKKEKTESGESAKSVTAAEAQLNEESAGQDKLEAGSDNLITNFRKKVVSVMDNVTTDNVVKENKKPSLRTKEPSVVGVVIQDELDEYLAEKENEEKQAGHKHVDTNLKIKKDVKVNRASLVKESKEEAKVAQVALETTETNKQETEVDLINQVVPYLVRVTTNEKIMITKQNFKLGKASMGVDYTIKGNAAISRVHAVISVKDNIYYIKDNKSTNHTFVNGKVVADGVLEELRNEYKIMLGDEEFVFKFII